MEIDFVVGIAIFIFMIGFALLYITYYFSSLQVSTAEFRDKAIEIFNNIFSSYEEEYSEHEIGVLKPIKRIPIIISETTGYNLKNEPIPINITFDNLCKKEAWNSTIRVYDENFTEIPNKISYSNLCFDQYLNFSLITIFANLSANSNKKLYIYFSNDSDVIPKSYLSNLSLYYKFDESENISIDYSGNEKNGILKNGTANCYNEDCPTWTTGKFFGALYFDGINDYVDCGDVGENIKTIEFWIKTNNINQKILQLNSSAGVLLQEGNVTTYDISSPTIYVNGIISPTINQNEWNYVVIITNNGIKADLCKIGSFGNEYFNGSIDEIRFWKDVKDENYILSRNISLPDIKIYPEEEIKIISFSKMLQMKNLSHEFVKGLIEEGYKFRIEIYK
jgi:hypothetical protein